MIGVERKGRGSEGGREGKKYSTINKYLICSGIQDIHRFFHNASEEFPSVSSEVQPIAYRRKVLVICRRKGVFALRMEAEVSHSHGEAQYLNGSESFSDDATPMNEWKLRGSDLLMSVFFSIASLRASGITVSSKSATLFPSLI